MNILEDLYYGNINPNDKYFVRPSEFAKNVSIIADNEKKLTDLLKALPNAGEGQHRLSQMMEAQNEISGFSQLERFLEGIRLGASIMLETFILPQQSVLRDIN